jgi:hypothetical protein
MRFSAWRGLSTGAFNAAGLNFIGCEAIGGEWFVPNDG